MRRISIGLCILLLAFSACLPEPEVDHTPTAALARPTGPAGTHPAAMTGATSTVVTHLSPTNTAVEPTQSLYPPPLPSPTELIPYPLPLPSPTQSLLSSLSQWEITRTCDGEIWAITYRLSENRLGLALVNDPLQPTMIIWDLKQEELLAHEDLLEIRLNRTASRRIELSFFVKDGRQEWRMGVVQGLCGVPRLYALLPVTDPEQAFLNDFWVSGENLFEYWIVESNQLKVYRWKNGQAELRWIMNDTPSDAVSPWMDENLTDLTGDGAPEILLYWYRWQAGPDRPDAAVLYQILQVKNGQYHVIGEIEPGFQILDIDRDGVGELLLPQPLDIPQKWEVYDWNGRLFERQEPLFRPEAPIPAILPTDQLPPLAANLYFKRGEKNWVWPKGGGQLRPVANIPKTNTPRGCSSKDEAVVSWSPDCRFSIVSIPGKIEGGSYGVKYRDTGEMYEIPGSFTYASGNSTFAWDPHSQYLVHARADGAEGIYRINPRNGSQEILLALSDPIALRSFYGAVDPFVLPDDSILFSVQGTQTALYPPLGIYRWLPGRRLRFLAEIAPGNTDIDNFIYGDLSISPDQKMFLFWQSLSRDQAPPYETLLLGTVEGDELWDLNPILGDAIEFQWGKP